MAASGEAGGLSGETGEASSRDQASEGRSYVPWTPEVSFGMARLRSESRPADSALMRVCMVFERMGVD